MSIRPPSGGGGGASEEDLALKQDAATAATDTELSTKQSILGLADKGAWSSATTYSAGDIVSRSYALYSALLASTNVDPALIATTLLGGHDDGTARITVGVSTYQAFTVNTATLVTQIRVRAADTIAAETTLAITSNDRATTHTTGTTSGSTAPGAQATADVTPYTLQPGVTYRLYCSSGNISATDATGLTPTGAIATVPADVYGGGITYTTFKQQFSLYGMAAPSWMRLSTAGPAAALNVVAASGSDETLPPPSTATIHRVTLTGNCTLTFPTATAGLSFTLELVQDGTGSRTVTWPAAVRWPAGTAPTLTTTAARRDVLCFTCTDGATWLGRVAGQNYTT